jgi:hypothetical protein
MKLLIVQFLPKSFKFIVSDVNLFLRNLFSLEWFILTPWSFRNPVISMEVTEEPKQPFHRESKCLKAVLANYLKSYKIRDRGEEAILFML